MAVLKEPVPSTTTLLADRVRAVSLEEEGYTGDDAVKRAMQALRIVVNGEFDALDELLASLPDILAPGGRAVFLTFHSGEDRRVKKSFKKGIASGTRVGVLQAEVVRASSRFVVTVVCLPKKARDWAAYEGPRGGGGGAGVRSRSARGGSWRRPSSKQSRLR